MSYSDAIADNPNTPPHLLATLSRAASWIVRWDVARHPNTPIDVLAYLTQDVDYSVQLQSAVHPNTPYGIWIRRWGRVLP